MSLSPDAQVNRLRAKPVELKSSNSQKEETIPPILSKQALGSYDPEEVTKIMEAIFEDCKESTSKKSTGVKIILKLQEEFKSFRDLVEKEFRNQNKPIGVDRSVPGGFENYFNLSSSVDVPKLSESQKAEEQQDSYGRSPQNPGSPGENPSYPYGKSPQNPSSSGENPSNTVNTSPQVPNPNNNNSANSTSMTSPYNQTPSRVQGNLSESSNLNSDLVSSTGKILGTFSQNNSSEDHPISQHQNANPSSFSDPTDGAKNDAVKSNDAKTHKKEDGKEGGKEEEGDQNSPTFHNYHN